MPDNPLYVSTPVSPAPLSVPLPDIVQQLPAGPPASLILEQPATPAPPVQPSSAHDTAENSTQLANPRSLHERRATARVAATANRAQRR